ncbi:tyrosine-type recombinase/integrase [Mesorhizobium marinum]
MGALNKLVAKRLTTLPPGKHEDGGGLRLVRRADGGSWWVLRITTLGRRREMGLGSFPAVSLAEARRAADDARALVRSGKDPIKERDRNRREAIRNLHLLNEVAKDAFEARKTSLKGDGTAGRWFSPVELHILPKLGKMPVAEISQTDIRDCLKPIWRTKAKTAEKAIQRLSIILMHAAALGLNVDVQATAKARALLGHQDHTVEHVPALPWRDVPAFYKSLNPDNTGELALRLLILTGVRSAPLRNLHESHISGDVWTIPAKLMKGKRGDTIDFRVPLSAEALAIIAEAQKYSRDGFLFPGTRKGVISDATMSRFMERRKMDARPHGFRSSLRDWIAINTDTPHEIAEMVLAHKTDSAVVRSYRRDDFLDQRRTLLEKWADHVTGKSAKSAAMFTS